MKRLIWFPTGRPIWVELAAALHDAGVATPVVWLGDDRHLETARARFPAARVLALRPLARKGRDVPPGPATAAAARVLAHPGWPLVRDHALKLMDRDDHAGRLTLLEREAWLAELLLWACALIEETTPDALVMAEAPHSAPMRVLHGVAGALGLQVLCFASWPLLPGLVLRDGLDGPDRPAPETPARTALQPRWQAEVDAYLSRFDGEGYAFQPRYMQVQANADTGARDLKSNPTARKVARWLQLASPRRMRAEILRARLKSALAGAVTGMPDGPYVYFPLHYEPERTTTPDGGAFHDQLRTLIALRGLLPPDMAIVVKEHPSVFNAFMNGHLGRHPRFYAALRRIAGLHLLPASASSADLLRGCAAVATITGTVALEGAALGKRALVFGNAWFRGAPNTVAFAPGFDWAAFAATPVADRAALRDWLHARLQAAVMPGTVNPSNERYFAAWYADGTLAAAELETLTAALQEALSP